MVLSHSCYRCLQQAAPQQALGRAGKTAMLGAKSDAAALLGVTGRGVSLQAVSLRSQVSALTAAALCCSAEEASLYVPATCCWMSPSNQQPHFC